MTDDQKTAETTGAAASPSAAARTPGPEAKAAGPAAAAGTPAPDAKAAAAGAAAPAATTLFGVLDADQRIRQAAEQNKRTLWAGAALATLVYASLIATQAMTGVLVPLSERHKERRGQDAPGTISVELVPDPDKTAKTKRWQEGTTAPGPRPSKTLPRPPRMAAVEEPEVQQEKPAKALKDEPRPEGSPMLLDVDSLVDAAAADLDRKIERAYRKKPQKARRQQQAVIAGGVQVRGKGASDRSDAFTRSVIAALMKTRPGPFALWGRVLVSFQITKSGRLKYVHLLHSSGNSALDDAAVKAIRKARFERPPPELTADERTYIIDYIFG